MTTNLNLPYRWYPHGARSLYYEAPEPGARVALAHAVWQVIEVTDIPAPEWTERESDTADRFGRPPYRIVIRPANLTSGDPRDRDHDVHLRASGAAMWNVYPDEHYPLCASCAEPLPCREQMAAEVSAASVKRMDRYSVEGVCPSCEEPITSRQKSLTFTENVEIPAGSPVTFHAGRAACRQSARDYEKRWVAADPKRRRTTLTCPGHVINHNDGTYECSELVDCRGPQAIHPSYESCRCPACWVDDHPGCHPSPDAQLIRRDAA